MSRGRGQSGEIQGYFCPVYPLAVRERWLREERLRLTELGFEKCCSRCHEWYPQDTEFFLTCNSTGDGLYGFCRCCYMEARYPEKYVLAQAA